MAIFTPYPSPNVTNMSAIFSYANSVTTYPFFGSLIPFILLVIFYAWMFKNEETSRALMHSSFVSAIASIFLSIANITPNVVSIVLVVFAIAFFIYNSIKS